jgi:hypothetical protein
VQTDAARAQAIYPGNQRVHAFVTGMIIIVYTSNLPMPLPLC